MNHAGEITPLTKLVRPHVAIVTAIEPVHLEYFGSLDKIADAKAEIFLGVEPGGAAVLNRDNAQYARLRRAAKAAGVERIVTFGEHARAEARLKRVCLAGRRLDRAKRASSGRTLPTSWARPAAIWCSIRSPCWRPACWPAPIWRWPRWRSPLSSRRPAAAPAPR